MNKGQAFAEFARGRYVAGREILLRLAETQGDHYAQLLLARAYYHGYWCLKSNRPLAVAQLFAIADKGYAPAAAEALRRARYWPASDCVGDRVARYRQCIAASEDTYAQGVIHIMESTAFRAAGLDFDAAQHAMFGQIEIEKSATVHGCCELAAADATWNVPLQQRAAILGFGDVQYHLGLYVSAAAQQYVPALLESTQCREFLLGIVLCEDNQETFSHVDIAERWINFYDEATAADRYLMGRTAARRNIFRQHRAYYYDYKERRHQHATLVCAFMVALKRNTPWLLREMRILIGKELFRALDEWEIIN